MDADYERLYHRLETSHWWFKSRRETLMHQLRDVDRSARVLDIGCSSGILLGELREAGFDAAKLHGIDISEAAIRNCHEAGLANCSKMDAQSITLEPGSFDLIIASDCLEHLEQEAEALRGWSSLLAPGGQMIIYVPAFQFLWGVHDTANQHFRRYTRGQLVEAVEGSDCRIVRSGYWNSLLFPAVLVVRTLARLLPKRKPAEHGDLSVPPGIVNALLMRLLRFERVLTGVVPLPVGVSTWCIAQKPE